MPSLRSSASSAPRSPLATAASADFKMRSFSDAGYFRRVLRGRLSTDAPLTPRSRCLRSSSCDFLVPGDCGGFGILGRPFSAHRYRDIQGKLSQTTLAQRGEGLLARRREEAVDVRLL